jgi:hypothetical protein
MVVGSVWKLAEKHNIDNIRMLTCDRNKVHIELGCGTVQKKLKRVNMENESSV